METLPSKLVYPTPFAGGENATLSPFVESTDLEKVNFYDGFPSAYSSPKAGKGKFVTRGEMNYLGYMATKNDYYKMCGGINTFDPEFSRMIGGYPKGAILDYFDGINLFKVISKTSNNKHNFNTDGLGNAWAKLGTNDVLNKATVLDSFDTVTYQGAFDALIRIGTYIAQSSGTLQINVDDYVSSYIISPTYTSGSKKLAGFGIIANVFDSASSIEEPTIGSSNVNYKNYSQIFTDPHQPEIGKTYTGWSNPLDPSVGTVSYLGVSSETLRKVPITVKAGQIVSMFVQSGLKYNDYIKSDFGSSAYAYIGCRMSMKYSIEIV